MIYRLEEGLNQKMSTQVEMALMEVGMVGGGWWRLHPLPFFHSLSYTVDVSLWTQSFLLQNVSFNVGGQK